MGVQPARIDYLKLIGAVSDRHVEIMRDDLSEIYYDASRDDVEYVFGDEITAIAEDGGCPFEHGASRRFDLIVGADGLHSGVRRIVFGDDVPERFLGGYLVSGVGTEFACPRRRNGRLFRTRPGCDGVHRRPPRRCACGVHLSATAEPLDYDHRDVARQQGQLCAAFGGVSAQVERWLQEVEHTPTFYFDAIARLELTTLVTGRVTLVGDAGYCPGPAVGGSTSLAVYGA